MSNYLKELLQPRTTNNKLIRLGRLADGGYIIDENTAKEVTKCYTYGVGDEISFEYGLFEINPKVQIHLYDHTIAPPQPKLPERIVFHKEGLHGSQQPEMDSFFNHLVKNGDNTPHNQILLKLDAEGAEYDLFNGNDISKFSEIRAMVIEFHNLIERMDNFTKVITNLKEYFDIIHIHPNNSGRRLNFQGFEFPDIPEFTLLNKKFNPDSQPLYIHYPIPNLDYANNGHQYSEFQINFQQ